VTEAVVTGVFYDPDRRGWVVEYDNRPDRQSHFGADKVRAIGHAVANGWEPPTGWTSGAGIYGPGDLDDTD
jgi:hypothetical protein